LLPDALVQALRDAQHVCVLTGAGISAESGIHTFREAQTGLWENYDPMDLATPEAFLRDPELVWRWYRWRRDLVAEAHPNAGHQALADLEGLVPTLTLVTQNVDGLHARAGNTDVIEFHGNLFATRCFVEGCIVEVGDDESLPSCPACGSHARPGVVWFGEAIPPQALDRSFAAARDCDVFLSVGTSSLVYPAAGLAELARSHGAIVAEINPNPTGLAAHFDHAIAGTAGAVLPELVACLQDT
jgi:NAD-dependent deacetylase